VWWIEWQESVCFLSLTVFRVTDVMQSKWGSGVAQSVKCLVCGLDDRGTGSIPGSDKRFSVFLSWAIGPYPASFQFARGRVAVEEELKAGYSCI